MFRNDYDTDTTTFDPDGRLHQVEFATNAIHNGGTVVALRSKTHAVVIGLKRSQGELASYQEKVYKIDSNIGIGISGIFSDGRVLATYMRDNCMEYKFVFGKSLQTERLVLDVSDKSQRYTQTTEKRPYGVGLLVIGYDKTGAHVFETIPSGEYHEYVAQAIGARFQAAKTYLQRNFESFTDAALSTLIVEGLNALKGSAQKKLTNQNVVIGIVGKDCPFKVINPDDMMEYLDQVVQEDEDEAKEDEED